jgi:DNA-binding protein HU-beta
MHAGMLAAATVVVDACTCRDMPGWELTAAKRRGTVCEPRLNEGGLMAGKADIVDKIADLTGMPKTRVAMVYDHMFDLLGDALKAGDKVSVPNFGTFSVSQRPAREGRNPATGAKIKIPASKNVKFKVSKTLKDRL